MTEYTPTTSVVRGAYMILINGHEAMYYLSGREARDEFNRWLKQVQAEAWDEGHRTPQDREMDDCQCEAWYEHECACGLFGTGDIITPNPYRQETDT